MIKLKNNHTGKTYEVSEQEYKQMEEQGTANLFTIVDSPSEPKEVQNTKSTKTEENK